MKVKPIIRHIVCGLSVGFFSCSSLLMAQAFSRIESVAGLSVLQENNGVAVADYDGDLDLDLFVVAKAKDEDGNEISHSRLFRNNNDGTFQDVTLVSGLMNLYPIEEEGDGFFGLDGIKYGVSWGDYDNDGFPDIFFTHTFKLQLFHNEGNGTFKEVTTEAGFERRNNCRNTGATWFDFNNDGFLDIYIADWGSCDSNSLYRNNGNGTFQNVTNQVEDTEERIFSYTSVPFDFNNDGWLDLYVTNDLKRANDLFINQNSTSFINQAQSYGVGNTGDDMGLTIGDYNNDGLFDIYVTNINANVLLSNNGNNTYTDVAVEKNVNDTGWAWGTSFSDFDLDGDEDLFVVNGFDFLKGTSEYNFYFKNLYAEGQTSFSDVSEAVNLRELTISVDAEVFDYDNDGDLDLYVTNSDRPSFFYENKTIGLDRPAALHWFKVALEGTTSNRDAIGTTVSITTNNGSLHRYYTGVGFLSQSLQPVHFGMGAETSILELKITWPSGLVEVYENLVADQTILATEGVGYEVLDTQSSIKIYGCTDPNSCSYNPEATGDDGSCMYLDSKQISGSTSSGYLLTKVYTYPLMEGSSANWQVSGGELIAGQGSGSVTIKWGLEASGSVTVVESNTCSGLPITLPVSLTAQEASNKLSIARLWNEALLEAIRGDYARPTVHARNLFHTSIAMYDSWALYEQGAAPYLIGNEVHGFNSTFNGFVPSENLEQARNKTLSYAVYRLLSHRFKDSPGAVRAREKFDLLMDQMGYDTNYTATDYATGDAAALGNFIAEAIISYGYTDGSREISEYDNGHYQTVNPALATKLPGNEYLLDPNRWQPLALDVFIDQSGNLIGGTTPDFLSPEWGDVSPFALQESVKVDFQRSGNNYSVYHDPKAPPYIDTTAITVSGEAYKWGFSLVSIWGSHLDPIDNVLWDISPKSIGNINLDQLPKEYGGYPSFYNMLEGGDIGTGYDVNPHTKAPYTEQMVPRGDYTRVLAEFWADGPDSETPPGHWFTLLNYVSEHELLEKKLGGEGEILDELEWDVKSYFIMGGAMHDAAIASWSIKGWYDYIRPISAIRFMAGKGQGSDPSKANYSLAGIPLKEGYIALVEEGDPLVGDNAEHLGKIKLYTWRGHDYINDTATDQAGVGWILAENWLPYQRPTFVTPPFAGYVSGHSTYSRAAAEVMTLLTGDEYFPGGYGEFIAKKNEFLVFEEGPSVDVKLQWATYRDASDQCSLSRIWGGIHPPADDIPGRLIGEQIGINAFTYAINYFQQGVISAIEQGDVLVYPNPSSTREIFVLGADIFDNMSLYDISGRAIQAIDEQYDETTNTTHLKFPSYLSSGFYILKMNSQSRIIIFK